MSDHLYDSDFYAWTQEQAARLRRAAAERINVDVDWENVAEEIESMGRSDKREIESRLEELLLHLAKLAWSPDANPRRGWKLSVAKQRAGIARRIEESPSLKHYPGEALAKCWTDARRQAEVDLDRSDDSLPAACPWDLKTQILDADWLPEHPVA
ncbi:DUF29 domain-containing protein [Azospirillum sp.]|uniref:DUF29 domain-containing protein n=1 Tax=Azospirillum sp. TaxID=34012 RepID=UPI002D469DAC|nr:DUF29 domain-containing protein [Azospirillum sp.]HYD70927.1 DUF29 domain-containing protein [Azospirillum sp.]